MDKDMIVRGMSPRMRELYLWQVTGLAKFYPIQSAWAFYGDGIFSAPPGLSAIDIHVDYVEGRPPPGAVSAVRIVQSMESVRESPLRHVCSKPRVDEAASPSPSGIRSIVERPHQVGDHEKHQGRQPNPAKFARQNTPPAFRKEPRYADWRYFDGTERKEIPDRRERSEDRYATATAGEGVEETMGGGCQKQVQP